ncbi:hypothetical protein MPSEU_000221900 [Mayamaea pseudoterrestris]|nr:hypothetical protein MPSEU_000221900 [Mayamaea pseudoterrestris]
MERIEEGEGIVVDPHDWWQTYTSTRPGWLTNARSEYEQQLQETHWSLHFTRTQLMLAVFDIASTKTLQRRIDSRVTLHGNLRASFSLDDDDDDDNLHFAPVAATMEVQVPAPVMNFAVTSVGRLLGRRLTHLRMHSNSMFATPSIITASTKLKMLDISLQDEADIRRLTDITASMRLRQSTLEHIKLSRFNSASLRVISPILVTLPMIKILCLSGNMFRSALISTRQDATLLCSLMRMELLESIQLEHFDFATDAAADAFCRAIEAPEMKNKSLSLMHVFLLAERQSELIKAVANSRLKAFSSFYNNASHHNSVSVLPWSSFATDFASARYSQMENVTIWHDHLPANDVFEYHIDGSELYNNIFDPSWVRKVKRTIDINRNRRQSLPAFEKLQRTQEESQVYQKLVRFQDVFAVHPSTVFEYMRHDKWRLKTVILSCHERLMMQHSFGVRLDQVIGQVQPEEAAFTAETDKLVSASAGVNAPASFSDAAVTPSATLTTAQSDGPAVKRRKVEDAFHADKACSLK